MKSTCKDVMKVLKEEDCTKSERLLKFDSEKIRIVYTTRKCQTFYGRKWNVPVGTVVIIEREFFREVTPEELGIKINDKEFTSSETDVEGRIIYDKKNGEVGFIWTNGYIDHISYHPNFKVKLNLCRTKKK